MQEEGLKVPLEDKTFDEHNEHLDPKDIERRNRARTETNMKDLIKRRNMLLIIVVSLLSLLIVGGAAASILLQKDSKPVPKQGRTKMDNTQIKEPDDEVIENNPDKETKEKSDDSNGDSGGLDKDRGDQKPTGDRRLVTEKLRTLNQLLQRQNLSQENRSILGKVFNLISSTDQTKANQNSPKGESERNRLMVDSLIRKTSSYQELSKGNVLRLDDHHPLEEAEVNRSLINGYLPILLI